LLPLLVKGGGKMNFVKKEIIRREAIKLKIQNKKNKEIISYLKERFGYSVTKMTLCRWMNKLTQVNIIIRGHDPSVFWSAFPSNFVWVARPLILATGFRGVHPVPVL